MSLLQVPDLASLHALSQRITKRAVQLAEDAFLARAKARLACGVGCLLDSAGPLMPRAHRMLLSGQVVGAFLQNGDEIRWWDVAAQQSVAIDETFFCDWLEAFHTANFELGGPILFPLLTYEALHRWARPQQVHPLWRDAQAIWLLCSSHERFRRDRGEALLCSHAPEGECVVPQAEFARGEVSSLQGWRESAALYTQKIHLLQRDIYDGNFYQANLSQRYVGHTDHAPFDIYMSLRRRNPSPFMGIFRWGQRWVLSGSPERLVHKHGLALSTRPIAGTKPRFADEAADAASRHDLQTSAKECAEHLMLVDLLRNDLGRVAQAGSVCVEEFAVVETYSHVHHLVSQVVAQMRPEIHLLRLLRAVFPGGTITGAPKIACMRRLAELEGEARGPYTGSLGFIDSHGEMDLNILIRSLIYDRQFVCFHAGGGIVADSCQDSEYLETRYKAQALMDALGID